MLPEYLLYVTRYTVYCTTATVLLGILAPDELMAFILYSSDSFEF